jgi:hypothetical protein
MLIGQNMRKIIPLALFAMVAAFSQAQIFDSGTGLGWNITDNNPGFDTFTVNAGALAGTLTQIDVFLNPAHTFIGDLFIDVQAPGGDLVSLLWIPGNAVANSGGSGRTMVSMFFADAGTDSDILGSQGGSGNVDSATSGIVYRKTQVPSGGAIDMSAVGTVSGTYSFFVADLAGGDTGTIDRVRIHTTGAVPEPATLAVLSVGAVAILRRRKSSK